MIDAGTDVETVGPTAWQLSPEDRDQPAGRVFALSLERALGRHRVREQQLRIERDERALHRYRISLRKTRSLLAAGRTVFPVEELELLEALMASHAASTSAARDLDVFCGHLDDLLSELPEELLAGAEDLRSTLVRHRDRARDSVMVSLDEGPYAVMMRRWAALSSVHRLGGGEPGPDALSPAGGVVDDVLWRAFRRLRRQGRRAVGSTEPAVWHTLRKRAKRARYEVGAFAPLYPEGTFDGVRKGLRDLQVALGSLQDEVVRIDLLRTAAFDTTPDGALVAGALTDRQLAQRAAVIEDCAARWERFDRPALRRDLRAALNR